MVEELQEARERIAPRLQARLTAYAEELHGINDWGADVCRRVADYSVRGKMIRGSLVRAGAKVFGADLGADSDADAVVDLAVAMELIQSFLLIHDDIMDNDDMRRGSPSVHAQYRDQAAAWGVSAGPPFGYSMGICAGDVTMLLAQRIIAGLQIDDERYRRVNRLVAQEIAFVGVAQMDDLYFGYLDGSVEEEKIYRLYRYKTGRYTFSLPLALGAVFAGMPDPGVERLMQYGEELGVVFQVIDDDIGLFGETEATGKPVGSDVSANKKTLHRRYFLDTPAAATTAYFGRSNLSRTEVEELRRAMRDQGVHKRIEELLDRHAARARELAEELARDHMPAEAAERTRSFLHDLVEYNVSRRA